MTDFAQLAAMIIAAVIIIPLIFFNAGGPDMLQANMWRLNSDQADFYSSKAILEQGAPYFVAVLAYAIGNQTIAQRLFAVREDLIKPTFLTATVGYGAVVIGLGMLGLLALWRPPICRPSASRSSSCWSWGRCPPPPTPTWRRCLPSS
ncbi:hypothetical protein G6F23_014600 [Rhizopus arrhizus]|nr:hypothetical protein G6F23_014600 [Rhizopus arrhizus]